MIYKSKSILSGMLIVSLLILLACSDSEDVYGVPPSVVELSLNTLTLYYKGGTSSDAIDIGIFFELPQDQSIKSSDLKGYVDSLITGSFSFLLTDALNPYNFNIYVGYVESSNDKSYTVPEEILTKIQNILLSRKDDIMAVTTAEELDAINNGALATIMPDLAAAGIDRQKLFGYLNPLSATKDMYDFDDISDTSVVTNDPSQYTEDEKDILIKRNIGRIAQLFEQYDYLDIWAIISKNTQESGYAYTPPDNVTNYVTPIIFQGYYHPFMKLVVDDSFAKIFGHELGHVLGDFADEYYPFEEDETLEKTVTHNCVSEGVVLQNADVFNDISDKTKNPYLADTLPRKYERLQETPDGITIIETGTVYDIPGPVSGYDGSLFPGCAAQKYKSYRTLNKSIMSFYYSIMTSDEWEKGFGAVHKHYIDWYIKNKFQITL